MSCSVKNLDPASASEVNLENLFTAVAKEGDSKKDGRTMSLQTVDKWLSKAQIIDGKTVSQSDVAAAFEKTGKSAVSYSEFISLLTGLAATKKLDLSTLKEKLLRVPAP